jgi:hypothetical protein
MVGDQQRLHRLAGVASGRPGLSAAGSRSTEGADCFARGGVGAKQTRDRRESSVPPNRINRRIQHVCRTSQFTGDHADGGKLPSNGFWLCS